MPHHHEYEDGELEEGELMEAAPRISSQGQPTSRTTNSNHSSITSVNVGIGSRNSHPLRPSSGHAHPTHSSHSHSSSSNSPASTSSTVRHALPRPPSFSLHPSLPPPPHRHDKGPRLHSSLDSSSHPGHNHNSGAHSGSSSKKLNIGGSNGALSPPQLQSSSDRSRHALPKKPRFDTQASDHLRTKRIRTFSPDGGEKAEERGSYHYPQNMSNSTSSNNTGYEKALTLQETSMASDHHNPIKNHDHLESSTDIQPQPDTPARGVEDSSLCAKSVEGSCGPWSKDYLRYLPPQAQQMSSSQEESLNSFSDQDPQDSNTARPTDNITLDHLEQHITILPQTSGPNYNNHHSPRIAVRTNVDDEGDGDNSFEIESLPQNVGQRSPLFLEGVNNSAYTPPASSPHAGMDDDSQDLQDQMESRENLLAPISEPLQGRYSPLPPVPVPVSPGHMAEVDVGRDTSSVYSMDGSDMIVESDVEPECDLQVLEPMSSIPATATPQQSSCLSSPVVRSLSDSIANDNVYNDSDRYSIESAMIPPTTQMTTSISEDSAASKFESETPASLIMTSDIQESATTSVSQEREQDDEAQLSDDCMDTGSDDCMDTSSDDGMTVDDTALMSNILLTTTDPLVHTINPCESQEFVDTALPCELLDKSLDAAVTGCESDNTQEAVKSVETLSHEGTQVLETLMDQKKPLAVDNPSTNDMGVMIYAAPTIEEQKLCQPQSPQPEQSEQPASDEDLQHENPMESLRVESIASAQTTPPMEMLDLEPRPQWNSLGPTPHQELTSDSLAAQLLLTIQPLLEVPLELESTTLKPNNEERLDEVAAAASTSAHAAEIDEMAKMGTESECRTIEGLDVSDKTTGGVTKEMLSQVDGSEEMPDQPDGSEEGSHKDEIGNSVDNHGPVSQDEGKAKVALQGMDEDCGEEDVDMDLETNSSISHDSEVPGPDLIQDLPVVAHPPAIGTSHEAMMRQELALLGDVDSGQTVEDSEWREEDMEDTQVQDRTAEGQYEEENTDITSAWEYQDSKRLPQGHPLSMPEMDTLIQSQDISTMPLSEDSNDTLLSEQESTRDVSDLSSHNDKLTSQIQHSVQPAPDSIKMEGDALNQLDSGLTSTVNDSELSDSSMSMSITDDDTPSTDDPSSLSALIIEALQSTQTVSAQDTDAVVSATPPTHDLKLTEAECTVKNETWQVEPAVGDPITDKEPLSSTEFQLVASKHESAIKEDSEKVEVNNSPIVVDERTQDSNSIDSSAISVVDISEMEEGGRTPETARPEKAAFMVEKVAESPSKEVAFTAEKAVDGPSDSLLTLPSHSDIDTITENSLDALHSVVVAHEPMAETTHESEDVKEKIIVQVQNLEYVYPNTAVATVIEAPQSATAMCEEDTGTDLSTGNSISTDVSGDMDDATSMAMEPCKGIASVEEEISPAHTPAVTMEAPVPMEVDQGEAVEMMSDIEMEGSPQTVPDLKSSLTETCISGDTMSQTTADDDTMVIISQDSGVSQLLNHKRPISDGGDYEDVGVKVVKSQVEMMDERMESPSQETIPFPSSSPPLQRPQVRPRSKSAIQPPRSALLDMHPTSNYRSSVLPSWHHAAGSDLALLSEMAMSRGDLNQFRREMRWQEERVSQTKVRDPGMEVLLNKALGREVTLTRTQPRVVQQGSGQKLGHVNEERNLDGTLDLDQERKRKRDMGEEQSDQGVPKMGDTRGSRRQSVTNRNGGEEGRWVEKVQLSTDSRLALSTLKIQLLSQAEEQERLEQDRRALERTVKRAHGRIEEIQREQQVVDARMQELLGRQKEMVMTLERHQVEEEEVKEVWRRQRAKSVKEIQDLVSRLKVLQGAATMATASSTA